MPSTLSQGLSSRLRSAFDGHSPQASLTQSAVAQTMAATPPAPQPQAPAATIDKLAILDQVLQEVEQTADAASIAASEPVSIQPDETPVLEPLAVAPQAVPQAIIDATDTLNAPGVATSAKEALQTVRIPDVVDTTSAAATVEVAPSNEMPVEVEGYLQEVMESQDQLPQEIVVADDSVQLNPPQQLRPVIVLPITPEQEAVGKRKSPKWSLRWLVEWSRKIMKAFDGKVIYSEGATE